MPNPAQTYEQAARTRGQTVVGWALDLFAAVRHLDPIILTGLPLGKWAAPQKVRWAAEHFPGTRIITCMARDKRNHAREGDVLVDDMLKYQHLWEESGGVFVHHRNVDETLAALSELFPGVRAPAEG
jgi:hypothetical protein